MGRANRAAHLLCVAPPFEEVMFELRSDFCRSECWEQRLCHEAALGYALGSAMP